MSHGPPTKQPWSHPTLYPTEETTVGLMENPKMGKGGRADWRDKGKRRRKKEDCEISRQLQRELASDGCFLFDKVFLPKKLVKSLLCREWVRELMVATHFSFTSHFLCLSSSALLISVLCLCGSGGRQRWRGENYAQWDTWRKQFEIEMRTTHPPPNLS